MSPTAMSLKTPIMLLEEGNWNQWRTYLRGRLLAKGLWQLVEPATSKRPTKPSHFRTPGQEATNLDDEADTADAANDGLALGLLIQCIAPSQFQYIENATTAAAAYKALADHPKPKTRLDRLDVMEDFYGMKWNQKQETLPEFMERYEIVLRRLRDADSEMTSSTSIDRLLQIMPWELRHVTEQVASSITLSGDFARVRSLLETEYKAAIKTGALRPPRGSNNDERALSAKQGHSRDKRSKKGVCHWCDKSRKRQRSTNKTISETSRATTHLMNAFGRSRRKSNTASRPIVVDSGASTHMTGDASLLTDLTDCDRMVVVATGAKTRATKMGTMRIKTSLGTVLVLKDVLLVDSMPHTLLSVATVMRKNPRCRLTFGEGECTIDHDGQPLAKVTLNQTDKVFTLELARNDAQAMSITATTSKSELWQQRAGHLPIAAINRCGALGLGIPSDLALPTAKCECCIQAKMAKVPNPRHTRGLSGQGSAGSPTPKAL
ncbi:hypothetical protein Ae201684P_007597 [Aphanomyces euteiches]|nr:hypothetical protein Ae201684P_007597 [Aphanomyces euteiches]